MQLRCRAQCTPSRGRMLYLRVASVSAPNTQESRSAGSNKRGGTSVLTKFGFKQDFADRYTLGPMLGSGSFGVVHVAIDKKTGERLAVKSIHKRFLGEYLEPNFVARIRHEVDIYRHMGQSLNVAHLEEAYEDDVHVDLVMELAAGGNMWQRIKRGNYSETTAAGIVREMLQAVAQCHAKGVVLRDVKPENFLFRSKAEQAPLKMIDFGLAEYCKPGQMLTERVGTPFYIAPEVLKQSYSLPVDIWSVGIAAYQLLTGHFPWHNDVDWLEEGEGRNSSKMAGPGNKALWRAIMYADFDYDWPPWDNISAQAKDCVQSMLQRDPDLRPTAAQLLRHSWVCSASDTFSGGSISGFGNGDTTAAPTPLTSTDEALAPGDTVGTSGTTRGTTAGEQVGGRSGVLGFDDTLVQRLQRYGTYGRFKQLALRQVVSVMSDEGSSALQGLTSGFAALDPQGTGRVPYQDVVKLLNSDNYDLSEGEVRTLMCQFDLNNDGTVDYLEWVAALIDWNKEEESQQWAGWLRKVFDRFDRDRNGTISTEELQHLICEELGGQVCIPDTVPAVLRQADADGDGELSFEEFVELLHCGEGDVLELFPSRRKRKTSRRDS